MAGVSGAAVTGRLSLAGAEARLTELFSYKKSQQKTSICHSERREESLFLDAEIRNEAVLRSE
jgi:hypothetical protein